MTTKNILLAGVILVLAIGACDRPIEKRKIKLAEAGSDLATTEQLSTSIYLAPRERRSIAVLFFHNQTGDDQLQWLQKGLTEMLIRSLSQSRSLSVISMDRLFEIINRLGNSAEPEKIDMKMAAIIAEETSVEIIVRGEITKNGDSLRINIKLEEPNRGLVLNETSVAGPGLESIFTMVDRITQKIKGDLQLRFDETGKSPGIAGLTTNSLPAWKHYMAGIDFMGKYLRAEAVQEFEQAIALDENFVSAYLRLCAVTLDRGEPIRAVKILPKLLQLKTLATPQEQYQIDLFEAAFKNDARKYIETVNKWLQNNPDDLEAHHTLADLYRNWNNKEQAIQHYENALKINPRYKLSYNLLSYMYAISGDYHKAIELNNIYKEMAKDEANPYDTAGEIHFMHGNYDKAISEFRQALVINNNFIYSVRNLGLVYLEKGEPQKALQAFTKFLRFAPDDASRATVHGFIGQCYLRMGAADSAIVNLQKSLKYQAFNFLIIELLNDLYLEQGDMVRSGEMLSQCYSQIYALIDSDLLRLNAIFFLSRLSLCWQVNREQTISLLKSEIQSMEKMAAPLFDPLNITNLKFYLTLLYTQTRQDKKIEGLWAGQEVIPTEFWPLLSGVQNHTYSDHWREFAILNQLFYRNPDRGVAFYQPLIHYAFDYRVQSMEMMLRLLLADLYAQIGKSAEAEQQRQTVGVPSESAWWLIGPFDNQDGFRKKFPPEKKIDINRAYRIKERSLHWQPADDGVQDGFINLGYIFKPRIWSVAYGVIGIEANEVIEVQFRVGTDDGGKLWLNDQLIWAFNRSQPATLDDNRITVRLKPGLNTVRIKVCNAISDWGFFFRVTDKSGNGVTGIRFLALDPKKLSEIFRQNPKTELAQK